MKKIPTIKYDPKTDKTDPRIVELLSGPLMKDCRKKPPDKKK